MTDCIDRYYRNRSFNNSIKIKLSFHCFSDFYTFYHCFFYKKLGIFCCHGKKQQKLGKFFELVLINWLILLIQCVPMDRWPSVREGFYDRLSILWIKNKQKSFTDGSITSLKIRLKILIDSINRYHRYRFIDPSPIVPIYEYRANLHANV